MVVQFFDVFSAGILYPSIRMTNGEICVYIPPDTCACDHIFEVAQPVQTWGKEVPVVNLPNRPAGSIYRILASDDNTTVDPHTFVGDQGILQRVHGFSG